MRAEDHLRAGTAGAARTYKIFHEFLFPAEKPPAIVGKRKLLALLARVDAY